MIVKSIIEKWKDSRVLLGMSPLACDMSGFSGLKSERIFPSIYNALSDHRTFYNVKKCGISSAIRKLIEDHGSQIELAGHGIVHVDHRLLGKEAQEMSILLSCNLIGAKTFIPPFNKWNKHTEEVCEEHGIDLIKFEDGWKHLVYEKVSNDFDRYYFHTHDFSYEEFQSKIQTNNEGQ